MMREKFCQYCEKHFFYEDGVDAHGVDVTRDDNQLRMTERIKITGYCPICIDPHRVRGMTYLKSTIISLFRRHLASKGIQSQYLDDDTVIPMLEQFPRSYALYKSNGTYRTFTILPTTIFAGTYGEFMMGEVAIRQSKRRDALIRYREIQCLRCNFTSLNSIGMTLIFFLGLDEKLCKKCDAHSWLPEKQEREKLPRKIRTSFNTSGLNRNGSSKSEFSDRALAKALNVSRNDFRRHIITQPEPPLPLGTPVGNLHIMEAYWDDKTYSPRYLLVCERCKETFDCIQKRVHLMQHFCQGEAK